MIEPDLMHDSLVKAWQEQGMNESQIEMASKYSDMFTSPTVMAISGPVMGVIFGVIFGLIVGLFTKRDRR